MTFFQEEKENEHRSRQQQNSNNHRQPLQSIQQPQTGGSAQQPQAGSSFQQPTDDLQTLEPDTLHKGGQSTLTQYWGNVS